MDTTSQSAKPGYFQKTFKEHPASVGETYLQHMAFAGAFAGKLFLAGLAAAIHAVIPSLFETTASRIIRELYLHIDNRGNVDN
ncbi:MAG: DUF6356 family protein [Stappiaceae bacterium]